MRSVKSAPLLGARSTRRTPALRQTIGGRAPVQRHDRGMLDDAPVVQLRECCGRAARQSIVAHRDHVGELFFASVKLLQCRVRAAMARVRLHRAAFRMRTGSGSSGGASANVEGTARADMWSGGLTGDGATSERTRACYMNYNLSGPIP